MELAIQILLLIVLTPIAGVILLFILNDVADSYWRERNRKYEMRRNHEGS